MKTRIHTLVRKFGWLGFAVVILVIVNVSLAVILMPRPADRRAELDSLVANNASFKDLSDYFTNLSRKKGALYAFDVLKTAPLPPNIDVHLLGHVIGDILYEQQGAAAITHCTQDFRNACSHTIVIGTLLEKGPESFGEVADLCRKAPGGRGAYTMCFHGLGHGVLAYNGYDLPKAVKMCEGVSSNKSSGEYSECVGGTIMEMIAGVHDRAAWEKQSKKYFKADDALYPCDADFIPGEAKGLCYTYLTPHLFESAGANLGNPDPATFAKAFSFCEPLKGPERSACFGGFGKEFTVLAQSRDIRAIDKMSDDQLTEVISWCDKAKSKDGKSDCMRDALGSLYWGGENDPGVSIRFCTLADRYGFGRECSDTLVSMTQYFTQDKTARARICSGLPPAYQPSCKNTLGI